MQQNVETLDLLASCYGNLAVTAKVMFDERFSRPFDSIQHQIFNKIKNSKSKYIAIAAPRGIGKTSINNLLLPAHDILFQDAKYIVPVSASSTLAEQQSENLKMELMQNEMIKKLFGDISTSNFSKEQWVVKVGDKEICIMPRGAGQQVRGMLYRNARPDRIIVDDLEDPDNMDSEAQRQKKKEWFFGSLLNCVDRGSDDWRVIVIGTVLHEDSLLVNLLEDPMWDSLSLEICDDDFHSYAPNFMSDAKIKELYDMFVSAGKVDTFFREYRNQPIATGEHAAFQASDFQSYEEGEAKLNEDRQVETMVIVDPAKTVKLNSAFSAVVGVGVNMVNQSIYVRDVVNERLTPPQLYDAICSMLIRLNARVLGIEVTSLHEFILHPLKNELARRGIHVELVELHARGGANEPGKISRIKQLTHYYKLGLIYHNKRVTAALEQQLLSFPKSKYWDVMDAFGYVPEMLEKGDRYMRPYSGDVGPDDYAGINEEMAEVDGVLSDDWRLV